jgi:uncharacterized protein YbjT (DUF2867 family)
MPVRPVQFLAVFGGSGATGRRIIERAVAQGLQVRTLVRHSSAFEFPSDAVEVLVGSLQSPKDVERTLCVTVMESAAFLVRAHPSQISSALIARG